MSKPFSPSVLLRLLLYYLSLSIEQEIFSPSQNCISCFHFYVSQSLLNVQKQRFLLLALLKLLPEEPYNSRPLGPHLLQSGLANGLSILVKEVSLLSQRNPTITAAVKHCRCLILTPVMDSWGPSGGLGLVWSAPHSRAGPSVRAALLSAIFTIFNKLPRLL